MNMEMVYLLIMAGFGAVVGFVARWGPLSGWAALAFALVLPPAGVGLSMAFC